uniref:Saposin B-type domain-containing protein n=1 Tax=Terrapene triunguis TaxID=2587831 RepID=A0A674JAT3_9SAUR
MFCAFIYQLHPTSGLISSTVLIKVRNIVGFPPQKYYQPCNISKNKTPTGSLSSLFCLFAGCVLVVSVIEQLAMFHNCTAKEAIERLCNYLPEILNLQGICYLVAELYGPELIKLLKYKMNADVVCRSIKLCKQNAGQPFCHLYPPPKRSVKLELYNRKKDVCNLNALNCKQKYFKYGQFQKAFSRIKGTCTLRGYHWRGRDCNEGKAIGVDPKDGIPYEKKFCKESKGIILLGDSAGAHFHIPPEWMTAAQMSLKSFSNLPVALTNELDWPHFSGTTGFLNSTIGGWTDSLYLRLRRRNRCNHRDFQNISKNVCNSNYCMRMVFDINIATYLFFIFFSLARNQRFDNPAIVIYASIGNDVCNGRPDTVAHMTTPNQMHSNVMQTLQYLNSQLPKGSHVILTGLVDGRFLWDQLHSRYHPLGQLNKDITYEQMYSFLSCLQISPCNGWMSSNETLRNLTSERALQLSNVLKEIARSEMFANFDIFYMDFPLGKIVDEWHKLGGESWQLIEPADGFHPTLGARIIWQKALSEWPHVLGKENPFNKQIEDVFKDQGGH